VQFNMHTPVLLKEVINILDIKPGDKVLDGTVGGGGYSKEICHLLGEKGRLIGLDQDNSALRRARALISSQGRIELINENFRNLDKVFSNLDVDRVDKIVFDLGISSDQLDKSQRGFSFQKNEPLLMTLKNKITKNDLTAQEIVNNWDEQNLIDILSGYGEEKFAKKIAASICEARKQKIIKTTFDLVEIIKKAVPEWYQHKKIHFATKTFQALRITVNDEIGALKEGLDKGFKHLGKKGKMVIISFHSKEDRIIKRFFKDKENKQAGILITKKPIIPTREEIKENPRSRSAKLRVIEKI